jgi:hypothetical protein
LEKSRVAGSMSLTASALIGTVRGRCEDGK